MRHKDVVAPASCGIAHIALGKIAHFDYTP